MRRDQGRPSFFSFASAPSVNAVAKWVFAFAFAIGLASSAMAELVAIPPLKARVTDLTGTLSPDQQAQLEASVASIETAKGAQVFILLLPSTKPEEIEQYGIRLADAWKVGRKGVDDGAIIIVAKNDRRMRIEVGYGLEGAIPDVIAKRIISDVMTTRFKEGDFFGGLQAAVDAIGKIVSGEPLPAPAPQSSQGQGIDLNGNLIPFAMVFIFFVGGILRAILGRVPGASVGGVIAFAGAWLLAGSLIAAIVVAIITFIFTMAGGGRGGLGGMGGGFGGGGFGGGGGGGFGGGGGGGFGGGGSSGSW